MDKQSSIEQVEAAEGRNSSTMIACVLNRSQSDIYILFLVRFTPESTQKGVNQRLKNVTQTQQQRPESPTVTLTWYVCKYKVHKLHQRYIRFCLFCLFVYVLLVFICILLSSLC